MKDESELLSALSEGELDALAESLLAPAAQSRLDELLTRGRGATLSPENQAKPVRSLERWISSRFSRHAPRL